MPGEQIAESHKEKFVSLSTEVEDFDSSLLRRWPGQVIKAFLLRSCMSTYPFEFRPSLDHSLDLPVEPQVFISHD